jgi:hypothetical protein
LHNADPGSGTDDKQEEQSGLDDQSDSHDGSQYNDKNISYEEYDGYTIPSEDNDSDTEYIQVIHEGKTSTRANPPSQLNSIDWKLQ